MTASDLVAFYNKHNTKLVTLQHTCGDLFERVWMDSIAQSTYEGVEIAAIYTAPENDPTKPTHAHPACAIDMIEVIE